jgi:hypothetical protein
VYVDPVQRRVRWKLVTVGARKKLSNGRRVEKPAWRKSVETAKKTQKTQKQTKKVIHQNTKTKTGMEEEGG